MLKVGDTAPTFTLLDQDGHSVKLADYLGKWVVLYFYPRALTPGCTVQACGIRDNKYEYQSHNIKVLGVSADTPEKLRHFSNKKKLDFTLLSDVEKTCIEDYGVWQKKKFMGREYMGIARWTFIIDFSGKIVHIIERVKTKTHHKDVLNIIHSL